MYNQEVSYTSLCVVESTFDGQTRLLRIADLYKRLVQFEPDPLSPSVFDNRYKLYQKNGPSDIGDVGVWEWKAQPNMEDPTKDYITSNFVPDKNPIEVIEIKGARSEKMMVDALKAGINVDYVHNQVIFVREIARDSFSTIYEGFFCTKNEIIFDGGILTVDPDVISLPVYRIYSNDIVHSQKRSFFNEFDLGNPERRAILKSLETVVKDIIISRATWAAFKTAGSTKDEWKRTKEFLATLPTQSLYSEISEKTGLGERNAEQYVRDFISRADQFIAGDDIGSTAMLAILEKNPRLLRVCEEDYSDRWAEKHKEEVEKAQKELETIKNEYENEIADRAAKIQQLTDIENQIRDKKEYLDSLKKAGTEVLEAISGKINDADKKMADFLADNIYLSNLLKIRDNTSSDKPAARYIPGKAIDTDYPDENETWFEVLETVASELEVCGVKTYSRQLAAFLCAAYIRKMPVILAGPYSMEIANAFSVSLGCRTAARLNLGSDSVSELDFADNKVVAVTDAFDSVLRSNFIELSGRKDVFVIFVCPFPEDLFVEPASLFNYALPILTDSVLDQAPDGNHIGGIITDSFEKELSVNEDTEIAKVFEGVRISKLMKNNISDILKVATTLNEETDNAIGYYFAALPYAYMTNQVDSLINVVREDKKLSKQVKKDIMDYLGVTE